VWHSAGMTGQGTPVTVTIKDMTGAGKLTGTITLHGIDSRITLRELIRTQVREEAARYNATLPGIFRGLVIPEGAQPAPGGFRLPAGRGVDWERQADHTLDAWAHGGFSVRAGNGWVSRLDEVLELTTESDIRFIRLVQLVEPDEADLAGDDAAVLVTAAVRAMVGYHRRDSGLPEIQVILSAPGDLRRRCIVLAARQILQGASWEHRILLGYIARKRAGMSLEEIESALPEPQRQQYGGDVVSSLIGQIEATWAALDDDGRARLFPQLDWLATLSSPRTATRLRQLTIAAGDGGEVPYQLIDDASPVGQGLAAVLTASPEPDRAKAGLIRLLAAYPDDGKPGRNWREDGGSIVEALNGPVVIGALLDAALNAQERQPGSGQIAGASFLTSFVTRKNQSFLCGLTVIAGQLAAAEPGLLVQLRRLALKAITGPGGAPRSIRLANHAVQAIADAALPASITELLKAERGTRHGTLRRQIRGSIDALATAQGLTRDELLERAVEDHGLGPDGTSRRPLAGPWLAVLQAGPRTATLGYQGPDGKPRKSLPPAVKDASADALAVIGADLKALRATIGNERARLDALLASGRSWPVAQWRELYLGHPVTGRLTRALIWQFRVGDTGTWASGIPAAELALTTSDGTQVPIPADDNAEVRLWHPVHATADEVRAWRQLLVDRQLAQPVKQAFREVYVLTPAEAETFDYSNRFAGHVFRQEQARALMKGRSWAALPLAGWDDGIDHGIARRQYPRPDGQAGLRAEFFFDPADDQDFGHLGMYTYCASDQVRFFDAGTGDPVPLAEVAPLIFSEAMRDVDLFIGVTSIGADPEWLDRGEGRRFEQYWHRWSFGDLNASAQLRNEVLAGLLPMLAIAGRCQLTGRFLVVRGDLRTYKIHLGSGNVLMTPDDQYLCIVAARDARVGKLFLPFDDDPLLSLILSKAFLLADDTNITDPSITRQIAGR
jgi:Domain of unknown function (DUF4132)